MFLLPERTDNHVFSHLAAAVGLRVATLTDIAATHHGDYDVSVAQAYAAAGFVLQQLVGDGLVREPHLPEDAEPDG